MAESILIYDVIAGKVEKNTAEKRQNKARVSKSKTEKPVCNENVTKQEENLHKAVNV